MLKKKENSKFLSVLLRFEYLIKYKVREFCSLKSNY